MAKFCKQCGKQLEDGEVCNCKKGQNIQVENISMLMMEVVKVIKGMIVEPMVTMKTFIKEENFYHALVLIVFNAIAGGIMSCAFIKGIEKSFLGILGGSARYFSGLEIPYMKIMFVIIVMIILMNACMIGIIYLVSTKLWKKGNYKEITAWIGSNAGFFIITHLVVAILFFINTQIAFGIYSIGSIIGICYLYKGMNITCSTDENKVAYVLAPTIVVSLYISSFLASKLM